MGGGGSRWMDTPRPGGLGGRCMSGSRGVKLRSRKLLKQMGRERLEIRLTVAVYHRSIEVPV